MKLLRQGGLSAKHYLNMAKKRKTLPKDFEQIVQNGSFEDLKSVFDKCDINAYGGFYKGNALTFAGISEEFVRWAVANGMDPNAGDYRGDVPLLHQVASANIFKLLLSLGADIEKKNNYDRTPLFCVASRHLINTEEYICRIKLFVENGAKINACSQGILHKHLTPLEGALEACRGICIIGAAQAADILLAAGAKRTERMKYFVQEIGKEFEYYRDNFNKDYLEDADKALMHLYKLFDVEPIKRHIRHDGISPITITATTFDKQWEELWNLLVPSEGHAMTVQGEVVRIIGKVRHEIMDNGAINWCRDYKELPRTLPEYFAKGNPLSAEEYKEVVQLSKKISANSDGDIFIALAKLAIRWIKNNTTPIPLKEVSYKW